MVKFIRKLHVREQIIEVISFFIELYFELCRSLSNTFRLLTGDLERVNGER